MKPLVKSMIAVVCVLVAIALVWFLIYTVPDVATKSVRGYFQSIIEADYQTAWTYIYPGSDFMKQWGGNTLSYEKFAGELTNARTRGTKPTAFHITNYRTELDRTLGIDVPVVTVWTENIVSGNPKNSDPKDYYLRKDKDGKWKIYKGINPQK